MADNEDAERLGQLQYGVAPNLVLTSDRRSGARNEPAGEPESLWGKVDYKFGDRAMRSNIRKELGAKVDRWKKERGDSKGPNRKASVRQVRWRMSQEGGAHVQKG